MPSGAKGRQEVGKASCASLFFKELAKSCQKIWLETILFVILQSLNSSRGVAQLVSALRSGRRGRAFESPHPDRASEDAIFRRPPFLFTYM